MAQVKLTTTAPILLNKQLVSQWKAAVRSLAKLPGKGDPDFLGRLIRKESSGIQRMWEIFNTDRGDLGRYLNDPKQEAVAYLLGFHLANAARLQLILDRCQSRHQILDQLSACSKLEIIDFGCGTGAMTAALLASLKPPANHVVSAQLIDRRKAFLNAAAMVCNDRENVRCFQQSVEDSFSFLSKPVTHPRILLFGYLINELLRSASQMRKLNAFLKQQASTPRLIISLDPANEKPAKSMLAFRQQLVEEGYRMLYPCSASAECPMLGGGKDWCFSSGLWERDSGTKQVDRVLKVNRSKLSSAAFVFASPGFLAIQPQKRTLVGLPLPITAEGKSTTPDLLLCDGRDLSKASIHRNSTSIEAAQASRGETEL